MQRIDSVYFAESARGGRGVFTANAIDAGSVIEICPVIVLSKKDRRRIHETKLHDYYFLWGEEEKKAAIILGFGFLYNHSYQPNAEYVPNYNDKTLTFYAKEPIAAGEEITVNYSGDPEGNHKMWFEVKEA
ncbi:MAG: SET domain-containing protein [Bacteroidota bacterium]